MDGEAGWWTTSGNIGLPPLARVMRVGRQQLLEFLFDYVVDPHYDDISLILLLGLCDVCGCVVVLDMSVRLTWYPM